MQVLLWLMLIIVFDKGCSACYHVASAAHVECGQLFAHLTSQHHLSC